MLSRRPGGGGSVGGSTYVLLFSSVLCAAVSLFSIAVALRERRRGSATWAWLLPGTGGVLLAVSCIVRLVLAA
jgi:hypothetical protein